MYNKRANFGPDGISFLDLVIESEDYLNLNQVSNRFPQTYRFKSFYLSNKLLYQNFSMPIFIYLIIFMLNCVTQWPT